MYEKIIEAIHEELDDIIDNTKSSSYVRGASDMAHYIIDFVEEMAYEFPE